MTGFGQNPLTGTQGALPANQFPIPTVSVPGNANGDQTALQGGPASAADSNGNVLAPASMYVYNGNDVAQGNTTDAAVVGDNPGTISAKLRGLSKIFNDVWDSVNHFLLVKATQNGTWTVQPGNTANTSAWLFSLSVGAALTPWTSQPTQTAAAAADTMLKFGSSGTTPFTHISIQNNGTINFVYSYDADSTAAGAKVYVLVPGQHVWEDRLASVLHCHSAAQVNFGGDTGITVEAFA